MLALNRTTLLEVDIPYLKWRYLLKPDGNAAMAKAISDYTKASGANGVLLSGVSPIYVSH